MPELKKMREMLLSKNREQKDAEKTDKDPTKNNNKDETTSAVDELFDMYIEIKDAEKGNRK